MTLFLDLFWIAALVVCSPVILWKLATVPRWRRGIPERFAIPGYLPAPRTTKPLIWVHAVSVGEVAASRALVHELEKALPDHEVAISTITATGLDAARKHFPNNVCFFYPVDMTYAVEGVLDAMDPVLIVLVELELWPNFLMTSHARGIPIVVVNGRISERSARRYQLVRRLIARPIRRFCVQTEEYARRFRSLGVEAGRVTITGNLKFDTQALDGAADDGAALRARLGIAEGAPVIVAGSTHPGEERAAIEAWKKLRAKHAGLRLAVAPRHLERLSAVLEDCRAAGVTFIRKTEIDAGLAPFDSAAAAPPLRSGRAGQDSGRAGQDSGRAGGDEPGAGQATSARPERSEVPSGARDGAESKGGDPVLVIDTLGELAKLYRIADAVFVGGSLIPHGGQNMLEPAALGKPVVFGPHVKNFQAIADALLAEGGALRIAGASELEAALGHLLSDRAAAAEMGRRARAFVERHRGAAKRTVDILKQLITNSEGTSHGKRPTPVHFRVRHDGASRQDRRSGVGRRP